MKRLKTLFIFGLLLLLAFPCYSQNNLKVYISVDMEGITGVVSSDHVSRSGMDYNRARVWMTQETNAAIEGAIAAGAAEIVVNDSHGSMRNILIDQLHPKADLISGTPKHYGMMEGIDETFDAVIFIGYHAGIGTQNAILDHTMSSARVSGIFINGVEANEGSLNGYLAGYYNVPVVFVSGDRAVVDQIHAMIGPEVVGVAVKEGVGRQAARNLSLERAWKEIREGVKRAIENKTSMPVHKAGEPVELAMEFYRPDYVDRLDLVPGVRRVSGRRIEYSGTDYAVIYKLMRALLTLSGS